MNKKRREKLAKVVSVLYAACEAIEGVVDEELDCIGNTPENLQSSDRYSQMEAAVDALESAAGNIEDAINNIESARV